MNILTINHYAGSPQHGMEFRPFYLSQQWATLGHTASILAASHSHLRARQPSLIAGGVTTENIQDVVYRWLPTPKYSVNGLGRVRNIVSFLRQLWLSAGTIAREFKPQVVIASSTYPMDIWVAAKIARKSNAKLVFEVHDLWPLTPIELNGMSRWHPFIMWCQQAEDYACRRADVVVSMLPKAADYLVSRGMQREKFYCVPNGISLQDWEAKDDAFPTELSNLLSRKQAEGGTWVVYAGYHGNANALGYLVEAAAELKKEDIHFVLIGDGPHKNDLRSQAKQLGINHLHFVDAIPKGQIPNALRQFDIAYLGWNKQPLYRFGISPNKLMDYMMAGLPVVHSVEAGNDPVSEVGCGLTVAPESPKEIAQALRQLSRHSADQRRAMGQLGQTFALAEQTYPVLASRFLDAIGGSEKA